MANTIPLTEEIIKKVIPMMKIDTEKKWLSNLILTISSIISLFIIIVGSIPSSVKSNSYLVIGLFICFIFKTIYDSIKMINIMYPGSTFFIKNVLNYDYNHNFTKYIEFIIPVCLILYLVLVGIFLQMFSIILPNIESPCLSRILNLKIFAFIFVIFIIMDTLILCLNKPSYYIISIALYTLMGMGFLLHYKKSVINLHNKLNDNCEEETDK